MYTNLGVIGPALGLLTVLACAAPVPPSTAAPIGVTEWRDLPCKGCSDAGLHVESRRTSPRGRPGRYTILKVHNSGATAVVVDFELVSSGVPDSDNHLPYEMRRILLPPSGGRPSEVVLVTALDSVGEAVIHGIEPFGRSQVGEPPKTDACSVNDVEVP